jgi:hypothetical protein
MLNLPAMLEVSIALANGSFIAKYGPIDVDDYNNAGNVDQVIYSYRNGPSLSLSL